jgi:hypothetical protein
MAAPPKRKRKDTSSSNTPSKRLSKVRSADKPEASPSRRRKTKPVADGDKDKLWTVRSIQAEKGNKYLIDWEDDPVTGESYAPTWVSRDTPAHGFLSAFPSSQAIYPVSLYLLVSSSDELRASRNPRPMPTRKRSMTGKNRSA